MLLDELGLVLDHSHAAVKAVEDRPRACGAPPANPAARGTAALAVNDII
jgi:hypothetical protein